MTETIGKPKPGLLGARRCKPIFADPDPSHADPGTSPNSWFLASSATTRLRYTYPAWRSNSPDKCSPNSNPSFHVLRSSRSRHYAHMQPAALLDAVHVSSSINIKPKQVSGLISPHWHLAALPLSKYISSFIPADRARVLQLQRRKRCLPLRMDVTFGSNGAWS